MTKGRWQLVLWLITNVLVTTTYAAHRRNNLRDEDSLNNPRPPTPRNDSNRRIGSRPAGRSSTSGSLPSSGDQHRLLEQEAASPSSTYQQQHFNPDSSQTPNDGYDGRLQSNTSRLPPFQQFRKKSRRPSIILGDERNDIKQTLHPVQETAHSETFQPPPPPSYVDQELASSGYQQQSSVSRRMPSVGYDGKSQGFDQTPNVGLRSKTPRQASQYPKQQKEYMFVGDDKEDDNNQTLYPPRSASTKPYQTMTGSPDSARPGTARPSSSRFQPPTLAGVQKRQRPPSHDSQSASYNPINTSLDEQFHNLALNESGSFRTAGKKSEEPSRYQYHETDDRIIEPGYHNVHKSERNRSKTSSFQPSTTFADQNRRQNFPYDSQQTSWLENNNAFDNHSKRLEGHIDVLYAFAECFQSGVNDFRVTEHNDKVDFTYGGIEFTVEKYVFDKAMSKIRQILADTYAHYPAEFDIAEKQLDRFYPTLVICYGLKIWGAEVHEALLLSNPIWKNEAARRSCEDKLVQILNILQNYLLNKHEENMKTEWYDLFQLAESSFSEHFKIIVTINKQIGKLLAAPLDIAFDPEKAGNDTPDKKYVKIAWNTSEKLRLLSTIEFTLEYIEWIDHLLNTNQLNGESLALLYKFSRYIIQSKTSAKNGMKTATAVARSAVVEQFHVDENFAANLHTKLRRDREIIYVAALLKGHLQFVRQAVNIRDHDEDFKNVNDLLSSMKAKARQRASYIGGEYASCYIAALEQQLQKRGYKFEVEPNHWNLAIQNIKIIPKI